MRVIAIALFASMVCGCASYVTPGRGAAMEALTQSAAAEKISPDSGVRDAMQRKPMANFPASVAIVRVQAPNYHSQTTGSIGSGRYSIVTSRDIESPADVQKLSTLPNLRGIAPLNRLVIPDELQSDQELRQAAAKVRADMVLVYTLDTVFTDSDRSTPLALVTLGIAPTTRTRIICTASAAVLDTRSGYIYGLAEASENKQFMQNAWTTPDTVDLSRREVETRAFAQLVDNLQITWTGIIKEHTGPQGVSYSTP